MHTASNVAAGRRPPERTVYVVTHPEATHHVDGLVGGQLDSALTDRGRSQATQIAAALRSRVDPGEKVAVVTSDLRRTRETASAVGAALGVDPVLDVRLREKSYGQAEGREQAWLDERFVTPPVTGDRMNHHEGIEGAETRRDVAQRVYAATADLLDSDTDVIVVITHGFAATFVVAAWIGMPIDAAGHVSFPVSSGSITTLREDGYFHNRAVVTVGETVTEGHARAGHGRAVVVRSGCVRDGDP